MSRKFELEKIAFIDTSASPIDVVSLSTLLEGADYATRAHVEDSFDSMIIEDNQPIDDTLIYKLNVSTLYSSSDASQLETWASSPNKLVAVGYVGDEVAYVENAQLVQREKGQGRRGFFFSMTKEGENYYDSNNKVGTEFFMSKNLLAMNKWDEGSVSGLASGWANNGGTWTWDSGNLEQDFNNASGSSKTFNKTVYFPFAKQLTFSIDLVAGSASNVFISEYEADGTLVGTTTETFAGTGIESVSRTLSATGVYVTVGVTVANTNSGSLRNPMLAIGSSTTYEGS